MAPMARLWHLMTDRDRAKEPTRSRRRPRPGWYLWPATRPRSTAIRMNCGRHGFLARQWRASADRRRVTNVSPVWLKAPCASFSVKRKSSCRTRCCYYLERRDAEFEPKMAGSSVCLPRGPGPGKAAAGQGGEIEEAPVAIVSSAEKPGIQAIATTAPDLPPVPGRHASFARDHEYKRHGTLSLLAGIDRLNR